MFELGPLYKTLLGVIRGPKTHRTISDDYVQFFERNFCLLRWHKTLKEVSFDFKTIDLYTALTPFEIERLDIKIKRMMPQILIEQAERLKKWSTILESSNEPTKIGTL